MNLADPSGRDPWAGALGTGLTHFGIFGFGGSIGSLTNMFTGETCLVALVCVRGGAGILVAGGLDYVGTVFGPRCGKDLSGLTLGVGADITAPGAPGIGGGAVAVGGGLTGAVGAGPQGGAGISVGIDVCYVKIIKCSFTPTECQSCAEK